MLRLATVAVLFCYVWRVQDLFPILDSVKFSQLASVAALGLFAMSPPALRALKRIQHPVMKWALVLLGLMVLSVPFSLYQGNSFRFIMNDHAKTVIMMIVLAASIRSFVDVERYAAAQLLGGVTYALFVLFRFDVGTDGRLGTLVYYDANDLGMLMVGSLPMVLYFARRNSPMVLRLLAAFAGGLYAMAIVKTGSRGAFLGSIAVGLAALLGFRAMPLRSRIGVVVVGLMAFSFIATDQYWDMMRTLLNPKDDYNWSGKSPEGRMEIWKRGVVYMMSRPATGVGVAAFPTAEGTLSPLASRSETSRGVKWGAPHNAFVQIGAELGIPGILVFLAMLAAAFRAIRSIARHRRSDDPGRRAEAAMAQSLSIGLVGYMVTGFFLSQGYAAFLYSMLGLIVGLAAVARIADGTRVHTWSVWFGLPSQASRA